MPPSITHPAPAALPAKMIEPRPRREPPVQTGITFGLNVPAALLARAAVLLSAYGAEADFFPAASGAIVTARRAEWSCSRVEFAAAKSVTREGPVESFRISVRAGSAWAALFALTALSGSAYGETPDISGTYWASEYQA